MDIGGSSYLTDLTNVLPTAANVEHYARIIKDKAVLRQLFQVSTKIVTAAFSQAGDVADLLDQAEHDIFSIAQSKAEKGFVSVSDLVHDVIETVEKLYQRKTHVTGVSTGFTEIDAMTSGFQPSNLIIIAGRPSMGKTSLAMNIAEHVALHEKKPVAVFSLEMSREELMLRMLCSQARVDSHKVRRGYLEKKYWNTLTAAASQIAQSPIYIDDSSGLSVLEMRARARRLAAELSAKGTPLALIMVWTICSAHARHGKNREPPAVKFPKSHRSLKALARKDLRVPIMALSQLSRREEGKGRSGRCQLSWTCANPAQIEQNADLCRTLFSAKIVLPFPQRTQQPGQSQNFNRQATQRPDGRSRTRLPARVHQI